MFQVESFLEQSTTETFLCDSQRNNRAPQGSAATKYATKSSPMEDWTCNLGGLREMYFFLPIETSFAAYLRHSPWTIRSASALPKLSWQVGANPEHGLNSCNVFVDASQRVFDEMKEEHWALYASTPSLQGRADMKANGTSTESPLKI